MRDELLSRFQAALSARRGTLRNWLDTAPPARRSLSLGPCCAEDAEQVLAHHDEALRHLQQGDFGVCEVCQGEVDTELLELDFTACVCLEHLSAAEQRLLERDLELAAKVQQHLLPQSLPRVPGLQLAALTRPAQIVGGDYFDFYAYPDGDLGLVVADVMGKGLSSSLLMSSLQASLRILGPEQPAVERLATRLNELFRYNLRVVRFISMLLLRIEPGSRRVHYCNAGHNPALWRRANGELTWLAPTGPALGLTVAGSYRAAEIQAGEGDLLLCYTDGLTEATHPARGEFGTERLAAFLAGHAGASVEALLAGLRDEAQAFAGGFQDDVTLVAVKFS
jgi:sigma-B regulation protein RsbU (phosphoserine phosphatase)